MVRKGKDPQASPTFPELCCHSVEDMTVMSERDLVSFHTTEEDREIQEKEIIPYWSGRSMREKILAAMTPEWNDCYSAGMFTEFMEQRGPDIHVVVNRTLKLDIWNTKRRSKNPWMLLIS